MIGVVADDLTGAAEIGAVGLRHGLTASVVLATDGEPRVSAGEPPPDLVCFDTDTRLADAASASERVRQAVATLLASQPTWTYKKLDSVLRGQVMAEVEAMMHGSQRALAFLLPANPELGRVIRDGRYYVNGRPVDETDFALDAAYPRRSAFVREMVTPPGQHPLRVCAVADTLPAQGIIIGEAESRADLDRWAAVALPAGLCAGGAEFFGALLRLTGHARNGAVLRPTAAARELFVCGSSSQAARLFQAHLLRANTPVIGLPLSLGTGAKWTPAMQAKLVERTLAEMRRHPRVMLCVGLERITEPARALRLSGYLVAVARAVLAEGSVDRVFAEGGTTAVELARACGWGELAVRQEWAPGVVALGTGDPRASEFVIKPGSYAWPPEVQGGGTLAL
jgi:uncharacterized protein YgbK (DUF1537 family)